MALLDPSQYGIRLEVSAASQSTATSMSQTAEINIWRTGPSTSSPTNPSTADWTSLATVASQPSQDVQYTDQLPNDGIRRWYRVRHTKVGWSPSTYYGQVLSATPASLPTAI